MSNLAKDLLTSDIEDLNRRYGHCDAPQIIGAVVEAHGRELSFASSFGLEDVALQHLLLPWIDEIEVVVLDTGRLPRATFEVMEVWRQKFGLKIRLELPQTDDIVKWVAEHGQDAFYGSVARREECCHLRKILPLERALKHKSAWFTGLRRSQSSARRELQIFERDAQGRLKVSPLAHWSLDETWAYVKAHQIPYNRLHDEGFPSIGCEPCTRAILPGEEIRAGRWWWEQESKKECGLHSPSAAKATYLEAKDAR